MAYIKIADFGMARDVISESFYTASGGKVPLKWTALEVNSYNALQNNKHDNSAGYNVQQIFSDE